MPDSTQHYPIVLAHGIARFDVLTNSLLRKLNMFMWDFGRAFDRLHYFRGIASYLERHGYDVYKTSVGFTAGVEVRAEQMAVQVRQILAETGQKKVHIIGHSMGGLDARQMIFQDREMADMVASVTSIGTPHNGTSLADYVLSGGGEELISALRPFLNTDGFSDITVEARQEFNAKAENWEASNLVFYQTYAGSQDFENIMVLMKKTYLFLAKEAGEGENDGLVSVSSQNWKTQLVATDGTVKEIVQRPFPMPVDHFNEIGWWDLHELSGTRWWRQNLRKEKKKFERAVREAYLEIVQDVTTAVHP